MVMAALGGRATRMFGKPDLGGNKGSHGGSGVHRCCCGYGGGGGLENVNVSTVKNVYVSIEFWCCNEIVKEECVERVINHAR